MARKSVSPGHKFGQLIGNFIEDFFNDTLHTFASDRKLYCDKKGPRPAVRGGKLRVDWVDNDDNTHSMDYVLEVGGSESVQGKPVAFIELAWRRYTKHSRNKSGEIEGALLPLKETYRSCRFVGAIIAGEYSSGGLQQLQSHGIVVLHLPFDNIAAAFRTKGIDIEYPERAPVAVKRRLISELRALGEDNLNEIRQELRKAIEPDLKTFVDALEAAVSREVESVRILSLFGEELNCGSIKDSIELLNDYEPTPSDHLKHNRLEIQIRFKNGSEVKGSFMTRDEALEFLGFYE
jgi:hypothetical protein